MARHKKGGKHKRGLASHVEAFKKTKKGGKKHRKGGKKHRK